ncbi:MAG: cobalt transporter CbiM [Synergistaceae bacterium]|jgi:cobalt/nickel transport system permease protein|nr:cobalt transporter CbiM [Synergistaceae bacterium]
MHISEGFLSVPVLSAGWLLAAGEVAYGLKKTEPEGIVRVAMISSAFFLASLINIRVGPGATHLSLIAPMGLLLGWGAPPAVFAALFLQAVLFQFGGLAVLGANTVSMGGAALCVYILFGKIVRDNNRGIQTIAAFAAGAFGVMMGVGMTGLWLVLSDRSLFPAAWLLVASHLPLAVIEGIFTAFLVIFLKRTFPDVLEPVRLK